MRRPPAWQAADLPKLELKWAFAFPNAQRARSQPAIAYGAVYVGSQDGTVYALDEDTGCVRWTFRASAEVRTAIVVESPEAARARNGHAASLFRRPPRAGLCGRCVLRVRWCWHAQGRRSPERDDHGRAGTARRHAVCAGFLPRSDIRGRSGVRVLHVPRLGAGHWMPRQARSAGRPTRLTSRRLRSARRMPARAFLGLPARPSGIRRPSMRSAACSTSAPAKTTPRPLMIAAMRSLRCDWPMAHSPGTRSARRATHGTSPACCRES